MADRDGRIRIFENSMTLCDESERLRESVRMSAKKQKIYWEDDALAPVFEKRFADTELVLNTKRTCEAAGDYKGKAVCVLNFASFVTPGGGVTRGTTAQEESICRISTLYKCITDSSVRMFYDSHWDKIHNGQIDRRNNDDIIFTPRVTVFRADTFECEMFPEEDWYDVDVITCAAPDLRQVFDKSMFSPSDDELREIHIKRWKRILTVAALHDAEVVILGAFGCGAFNNSPWVVAKAAEQACKDFDGVFETIVFAVYTRDYESDNFRAFSAISGMNVHIGSE